MSKVNREFIDNFFKSPIVKCASKTYPKGHELRNKSFTERLVYIRNKVIEKNIDLSAL